jgi:hypothetical protein
LLQTPPACWSEPTCIAPTSKIATVAPVIVAIHDLFPWLRHLFTVRAYAGERLRRALTKFGNSVTDIVPPMADTSGFKVLPRCWVATALFSLAQSQSPPRKRF